MKGYNLHVVMWMVALFYGVVGVDKDGVPTPVPACDSAIYCDGPLLTAVQDAHLEKDSKHFVDMNMKADPDVVLAAFNKLSPPGQHSKLTKKQVAVFVKEFFEGPGTEFEPWIPTDYIKNPAFLKQIKDQTLRQFAKDLCGIWKDLGRKIRDDVRVKQQRYSLIYLQHPFIIPGGRFREIYYWDSYWVMKGLLICEMNVTVKGMLGNLISLFDTYGLVPNGGRIYYTRRSQPPFLTPMVNSYYEATDDVEFIRAAIGTLEKEYDFWMNNRSVDIVKDGRTHTLNRFKADISTPRPESYKEDMEATAGMDPESKMSLLVNLASAAESGWDFSSRWFSRDVDQALTLNTTVATDIVPVDLNGVMCLNEMLLAKFNRIIGRYDRALFFVNQSQLRREAIRDVLWNKTRGVWLDYSLRHNASRDYFFPSNLFPWFAECFGQFDDDKLKTEYNVLSYLKSSGALTFAGGIPTSLLETGQQWDFPNGWPPLEHYAIEALSNGRLSESRGVAFDLARRWVHSNYKGWSRTKHMFEKYSVTTPGSRGGGGEYDVQEGFGWTNGVALDLMHKYGDRLTLD